LLTFLKKLYLASDQIYLTQIPLWTTNIMRRMWIAHCSLFLALIYFMHNSTVFAVSKQHKHHSTNPSMCHCSEPGHFATFSPTFYFNTTYTYNTATHKLSRLTKMSPLCRYTDTSVCIFPITNLHFAVWRRKDRPVHI
jgi:hypothetical protein